MEIRLSKTVLGLAISIIFGLIFMGCQLNRDSDKAPEPSKSDDEQSTVEQWLSLEDALKKACVDSGKETTEFCSCSAKAETEIYRKKFGKVEAIPEQIELDASETSQVEAECRPKSSSDVETDNVKDESVNEPTSTEPSPNVTEPTSSPITLPMLEGSFSIGSRAKKSYQRFEITDTAPNVFEMAYSDTLTSNEGSANGTLTLVSPNVLRWKVRGTSYNPMFKIGTYLCRFQLAGSAPGRTLTIECGTSGGPEPLDLTSAISLLEEECFKCD